MAMAKIIYTNRELIIASFVAVACLALSAFFPAEGKYQNFLALAVFLVLIPVLYVKTILKRSLSEFGIQVGDWKKGIILAAASLALSLLFFYILLNYSGFLKTQNFIKGLRSDFGEFAFYEVFFVGSLTVVFELFFRGFVMHSLMPKFGKWAIALQGAVFLAYLLATGSLELGSAYFILASFFSGWIVFESRSLIYSFAFSWIFILIADAIVIRLE